MAQPKKLSGFIVPWYANGFRGDVMEKGLEEIAPIALRYGAVFYTVVRSLDDRYKFEQISYFADKSGWGEYWAGPEFTRWRALHSGHYQVPILPTYHEVSSYGGLRAFYEPADETSAAASAEA